MCYVWWWDFGISLMEELYWLVDWQLVFRGNPVTVIFLFWFLLGRWHTLLDMELMVSLMMYIMVIGAALRYYDFVIIGIMIIVWWRIENLCACAEIWASRTLLSGEFQLCLNSRFVYRSLSGTRDHGIPLWLFSCVLVSEPGVPLMFGYLRCRWLHLL